MAGTLVPLAHLEPLVDLAPPETLVDLDPLETLVDPEPLVNPDPLDLLAHLRIASI